MRSGRTTPFTCHAGRRDVGPRKTVMPPRSGATAGYYSWPRGDGPEPVSRVKRSRVAPVAAWIFQRRADLRNHEARSGRPISQEAMIMRFYNQQHRFYAGGDLHARSLFLHILDDQGQTRFEKNLPAGPDAFLDAIAPFRDGLVVGVECMFAWYWL